MLSPIIPQESINQLHALLNQAEKCVIVTHISPDGDALGSSLALFAVLQELNKKATIIIPNPFPQYLEWMPETDKIKVYEADPLAAEAIVSESDLIFGLDFNTASRIDGLKASVLGANVPRILIDHHPYPDMPCDVLISFTEIASTSELLFRVLCQMGYEQYITLAAAEAIYVGMMTDTGNFSYNSQNPEIYTIIGQLLRIGIDKDMIYRKVYNNYSADRMRLMGYCIYEKMKLYPDFGAAVIALTKAETDYFNHQPGDCEGFGNIPLSIRGIDISVFVREDSDKVKLSFRSQGEFPVNKMAEMFNGGGHKNAAGGESYLSLDETLKKLEGLIENKAKYL